MSLRLPLAHIREESPLRAVFPAGCPVQRAIPERGRFAGEESDFYRSDFKRCSDVQRRQVATLVAEQCGGTADEVLGEWRAVGWLPLRARHVSTVCFDGRLLL